MTPLAKVAVLVLGAAVAAWAGWRLLLDGVSPRAIVPGVAVAIGLLFLILRNRRPRWNRDDGPRAREKW